MPMGSNRLRLNGGTRKQQAMAGLESNAADLAILNMAVDSQASFRRRAPSLSSSNENKAMNDVFTVLLSDANRELASLLRDVRTGSPGVVFREAQGQQVSELLMRAVRCAAKQYMLQAELSNLAITDELTCLYNRRGFMALAERQLKVGRRTGRGMLLFMMDVNGLKQINDSFGHLEGDLVLKRTAKVLEETFRDSDVVARFAGDEFAVLALEAAGHSEPTMKTRLYESLRSINAGLPRYEISLSLGVARFDPRNCTSIEELMAKADLAMYEQKRRRSATIPEGRRSA